MKTKIRICALLLATAVACATSGGAQSGGGGGASAGGTAAKKPGGKSSRFQQADFKPPAPNQIEDEAQRNYMSEAQIHLDRGTAAQAAGNLDQARQEYAATADGYAALLDKFPGELYRMPLRMRTAELYLFGQQPQKAAEQAQKVLTDPEANAQSKALAAKLAAEAWLATANQKVRAGQLDPIRLANADHANLVRTARASQRQLAAARRLKATGDLERLPEPVRQAAPDEPVE